MVVGVDARALQTSRGVWRYLACSLAAMADAAPETEFRLLAPGNRPLIGVPSAANVELVRPRVHSKAYFGASAAVGRPRLDDALGHDLDVFWLPSSNGGTVSSRVPYVLTVHDLSFTLRPDDFTPGDRFNHRLTRPRAQAIGAARLITHTRVVRDELQRFWGIPSSTVDVIAPGLARPAWPVVDGRPRAARAGVAEVRGRYGLPEPYVLQVGALEPRKRPELTARAAAHAGIASVFAGTGRMADELHGRGVHLLGHVPDGDLDVLYAGATALCYPSMLEGYGFPPLEAALRGTPAIVSDLPVLREALEEDGALFVTPGSTNALTQAIAQLAEDPIAARERAQRAYSVAAGRTWEATARGVLRTLRASAGIPDPRPSHVAPPVTRSAIAS